MFFFFLFQVCYIIQLIEGRIIHKEQLFIGVERSNSIPIKSYALQLGKFFRKQHCYQHEAALVANFRYLIRTFDFLFSSLYYIHSQEGANFDKKLIYETLITLIISLASTQRVVIQTFEASRFNVLRNSDSSSYFKYVHIG